MWYSPCHPIVAEKFMHAVVFSAGSVPNRAMHLSSPSFSFCLGGRAELALPAKPELNFFGETVLGLDTFTSIPCLLALLSLLGSHLQSLQSPPMLFCPQPIGSVPFSPDKTNDLIQF